MSLNLLVHKCISFSAGEVQRKLTIIISVILYSLLFQMREDGLDLKQPELILRSECPDHQVEGCLQTDRPGVHHSYSMCGLLLSALCLAFSSHIY